ncbi:uncharacterized protein LOC113376037 [Ctenocephalides felis]|uniref:uncharacterized protein LOC113376037 n=1 Tax=Ctenocephalides felis TaxID=7515 RepID=UPI000E6E4451|nr:uncharacterized protein LOC113376037 [Ctenocephalides felis]
MWNFCLVLSVFGVCVLSALTNAQTKGAPKVLCSESTMRVEIEMDGENLGKRFYLDHLQHYPDEKCKPRKEGNLAVFELSLDDIYQCGVTRMVNKISGKRVYYHKIIVESEDPTTPKEIINVKCAGEAKNHTLTRRNVLPAGFQEPEDLEITNSFVKDAPEPILGVGVRQAGRLVTGELNVSPGTPLQMEIFLDNGSAPVYGILATYMQVTDTKSQEETIIFNGCSVDPYLFENFNTVDGDFLSAKFRAFKFPDSTYVQFRGTVNVCLDKCTGVECSNGQIGYGRRRRDIRSPSNNKVYEISMTTFIKVNYDDNSIIDKENLSELENQIKRLKITNQKLARNSRAEGYFVHEDQEEDEEMDSREAERATVEETSSRRSSEEDSMESAGAFLTYASYLSILTAYIILNRLV